MKKNSMNTFHGLNMMKDKLAIFDLDGTLFDTSRVNYLAYKNALNKFDFDIDYTYYKNFCEGKHYCEFLQSIVGNN